MEYSWGEDTFYQKVADQFSAHNCHYASMVVGLGVSDRNHKRNAVFYFISEFLRLGDFLTLLSKLELLGKNAPHGWAERHKDVILTLLRSIYEGSIKINYIFGVGDLSISEEWANIEERFQEIVDIFRREYNTYSSALDKIDPEKNPFSELSDEGKKLSIKSLLEKYSKNSGLDEEYVNTQYQVYKYFCFYSHGNANPALWLESKVELFPVMRIFTIIDFISRDYLYHLSKLLRCEKFDGLLYVTRLKHEINSLFDDKFW
ncbi:hypothetical protein HX037_06500 [Ignatzschineria indica]|uniref:hypothetical protein n=1 Tax=Ignatzschineria indica TaxID=472583 RepID=UPI002575750C|nr:hypothetical protein [Ignatzschineria indica]MDM1545534.1 hypothetical protein [Ignatzschineria indica]